MRESVSSVPLPPGNYFTILRDKLSAAEVTGRACLHVRLPGSMKHIPHRNRGALQEIKRLQAEITVRSAMGERVRAGRIRRVGR